MSTNRISAGGFSVQIAPQAEVDDWESRQGLPDAQTLQDILSSAEHGYCPYLDEASYECGDEPVDGHLYCARHMEQEQDRGEDTSLEGLRAEIAAMPHALPDGATNTEPLEASWSDESDAYRVVIRKRFALCLTRIYYLSAPGIPPQMICRFIRPTVASARAEAQAVIDGEQGDAPARITWIVRETGRI